MRILSLTVVMVILQGALDHVKKGRVLPALSRELHDERRAVAILYRAIELLGISRSRADGTFGYGPFVAVKVG
jgi:hypothetical protein